MKLLAGQGWYIVDAGHVQDRLLCTPAEFSVNHKLQG